MKTICICINAIAMLAACQVHAAFVDWTSVDTTNQIATGTLGSVAVTLTTTTRVPNLFSSGGILGGILDETSLDFSNHWFAPNIPLTDSIGLASSSSFALHFSPPITNPTLHLFQLATTTWNFTDGFNPISFTLVNSDGNFTIATGASATAIQGKSIAGSDASGSLYFAGTFSDINWYVTTPNPGDGVDIQISVTSASSLTARLVASSIVCSWPTNAVSLGLQSSTNLVLGGWLDVTNIPVIAGTNYSVALSADKMQCFFRLKK